MSQCQVIAGAKIKEKEKIEKYQDLRRELCRIWYLKTKVLTILVHLEP